jgi:acyl-CoA synthetase (NDP forming)
VITAAGGFAETGEDGARRQDSIRDIAVAAAMPVVGPNGVGVVNVPRGLELTLLAPFERRPGGLSVIAHSGAVLESLATAGWRVGGVGLDLLISAGNEPVTDVADYLDYLAGREATKVIALIIEKVRRPAAFFAAVRRCLAADKPVVAVKLGRSERGQRMAASHTGAVTTDAWVYDVAFDQAGIVRAEDIDDLADRVQFLEQLPRERWSGVTGLAVLTASGGFAALASDLAEAEGVAVPELGRLRPFIKAHVPGGDVPNPLDATAFMNAADSPWEQIVERYATAPEIDTLLFANQFADWDQRGRGLADRFLAQAKESSKTLIISPLAGTAGQWVAAYRDDGAAIGNGLRGTFRGLSTMARYRRAPRDREVRDPREVPAAGRPDAAPVLVPEGEMLPFDAAMRLLAGGGITVAPWTVFAGTDQVRPPGFAPPYVVKLADVAHRTEHGAVRAGVTAEGLDAAVTELRGLASASGLASAVAVQPAIRGLGEVFVGMRDTELGPLVVFGAGGVFLEALGRIAGRIAPLSESDAADLVEELAGTGLLDGFRGGPPWSRPALTAAIRAAGDLIAGGRDWIESVDVNPLIVTETGLVAVDALCLLRPRSHDGTMTDD